MREHAVCMLNPKRAHPLSTIFQVQKISSLHVLTQFYWIKTSV